MEGEIADCTKAIQLRPDFAEPYFNRGIAKDQKGDLAGGKADKAKALELVVAEKQFKTKAIQLNPNNAEANSQHEIVQK